MRYIIDYFIARFGYNAIKRSVAAMPPFMSIIIYGSFMGLLAIGFTLLLIGIILVG